MERTFPQKVKPVPSCEVESGVMVSQIRQTPPEVNRLVRTSAVMLGLAISVGAYSLPLPNQSDEAVAAEPAIGEATAGEATAIALSSKLDASAALHKVEAVEQAQALSPSGVVKHTVQEGQTLWQLAHLYRVDAATVALDNGISVGAVLHVGQVLKIPVGDQPAPVAQTASIVNAPGYYGPSDSAKSIVGDSASTSNAQDGVVVLNTLKQKQERLRLSLAGLKSSDKALAASTTKPAMSATKPSTEASYRVVLGDTLDNIARSHGVSLAQLAQANRLANPNILRVDQLLVIPQASKRLAGSAPVEAPIMIASANPEQLTLPASNRRPQLFSQSKSSRSNSTSSSKTSTFQPVSQTEGTIDRLPSVAVLPSQMSQVTTAEQTLPAISLNHSSIVPVAIGGNTEVATASFAGNSSTQGEQPVSNTQQSYVEHLRLEIVKLREKYQDTVSQVQPTAPSTKVASSSLNVAAPVNPELPLANPTKLKPTRYTRALQSQVRQLQASHQQDRRAEMKAAAADLAPVASPDQSQLVATASIGSQNYEPLVRSSIGQMVSPDLPPIGSIDAYLPGNSGKFAGYIWPAKGVLTSGFGYRWGRLHKGIDIAAPVGTPIFAAASGVVITAGWNSGGYGNMVEIQHPDGSVTLYAHNSRIVVQEGQEVAQGQQIADMGSTGYSTGPHSHFEVHLPGKGAVNPMAHLPRNQA